MPGTQSEKGGRESKIWRSGRGETTGAGEPLIDPLTSWLNLHNPGVLLSLPPTVHVCGYEKDTQTYGHNLNTSLIHKFSITNTPVSSEE